MADASAGRTAGTLPTPVPGKGLKITLMTLIVGTQAASRQYLDTRNQLSLPGRAIHDLGLRHATRMLGRSLVIRAAISNPGNKVYWAKPHYTSLGLGAPRTFMLSVTMDL